MKLQKEDVFKAANTLEQKGERPTAKKIRLYLGSGSLTTITKYLNEWCKNPKSTEINFNKLLSNLSDEKLASFFVGEHPQVCALVFSNLAAEKAATLLKYFPMQVRTDILDRIEKIEPVQKFITEKIFNVVSQELSSFVEPQLEKFGGVDFVEQVKKELAG